MSDLTPMLEQYRQIKEEYQDALVFFRLGDFYEMFYGDAEIGARELDITLTARPGRGGSVPMCGVPYHAAEGYIARLAGKGYRIAICEQVVETGSKPKLMERRIVRVVTPGTVMSEGAVAPKDNNYVAAMVSAEDHRGIAFADVSTGEFFLGSFPGTDSALEEELAGLEPAELVVSLPEEIEALSGKAKILGIRLSLHPACNRSLVEAVTGHFGLGTDDLPAGTGPTAWKAAGLLLNYLLETQKNALDHLQLPRCYRSPGFMVLDGTTRRNLELVVGRHTGSRQGSLLAVLDFTLAPMGGRLLRRWLEYPLSDLKLIEDRLDSLEEVVDRRVPASGLRDMLGRMRDMERLVARTVFRTASPRDLLALKESMSLLPGIKESLTQFERGLLPEMFRGLDPLSDLASLLEEALDPECQASLEQGGFIRTGYHPEVDKLREIQNQGRNWIASLEARERERTGVKSLKVGYNRVFGYYLEVTRANLSSLPADYQRKQTLANAERFVTPELQEYEEMVLGAEEKLIGLERKLFAELNHKVSEASGRVQKASGAVAVLDCLLALAEAAVRYGFVRPVVDDSERIAIHQGVHPVVERYLGMGEFVANDALLDGDRHRTVILTGPNMAGKSTYMRQVALIVIMAQMGGFVPAASAHIGVVDRIFTRVGATDDVISGRSTFLMEMLECRAILEGATGRSLVIMDEVGRGTSTYDGLSLARAILEFIHVRIGCRTLFSTHYHELSALEESLPGVVNCVVAVEERDGQLLFLRTVSRGRASKSYGIQVAALAGLPAEIVDRAREIMAVLEESRSPCAALKATAAALDAPQASRDRLVPDREEAAACGPIEETGQLKLFQIKPEPGREAGVIAELQRLDLVNMTPLEALNKLNALQNRLKKTTRQPGK